MKAILFALAVFVAGASTLPQTAAVDQASQRIINDIIVSVIEDTLQAIRDRGLDPFYRKEVRTGYALPVSVLFNVAASAHEVHLVGLSNVIINAVDFNTATGDIFIDLSLPHLRGSVDGAGAQVTVFGRTVTASGSGSFAVSNLRVAGRAQVSIDLVDGVSVSNVDVSVSLGAIQSDIILNVHDYELSHYVNAFFNDHLFNALKEYSNEIGELLAIFLTRYVNNRS